MAEKESFKRGTIPMVLLSLLKEQDMYGYQLGQELKLRSDNRYSLLETSMYPVLYRLEDQGYITSTSSLDGRRRIVHYHITDSGLAYLEQLRAEYLELTAGIYAILESTR